MNISRASEVLSPSTAPTTRSRAKARSETPAAQPPPVMGGGAINLGGTFSLAEMLPMDGRDPALANGLSSQYFGDAWVMRRVAELIALYDHPLYSFFAGVEALTREQSLRTTAAFGTAAVGELFSLASSQPDRFYHRLPANVLDLQRDKNNNELLREDIVALGHEAAKRRAVATGTGGFPVVGRIGDDLDEDEEEGGIQGAQPGVAIGGVSPLAAIPGAALPRAAEPVAASQSALFAANAAAGQPNYVLIPGADDNVINPADPMVGARPVAVRPEDVGPNPAFLQSTAKPTTDPTRVAVQMRHTATNVRTIHDNGEEEYVYNIEDGDVVALRRLLSGKPLSDADERMWRTVYQGGVGVTTPAPRQTSQAIEQTRISQRQQVIEYAQSVRTPSELHWKTLPENLRTLFLTRDAVAALEHATWLAHYQQPWDYNAPPPMRDGSLHRQRQMVPAIDLMTHEMVRVPFQSLVANVIIYWRQRRAQDKARAAEALEAINGIILTLRTMRDSPDGFVSLLGHYDVEARRSRAQIQQQRDGYYQQTGNYWSDMDRTFYSHAMLPRLTMGRHVASVMRQQRQCLTTVQPAISEAIQASMMAAPRGVSALQTLEDARFRYNFAASVLGQSHRK